MSITGKNWYISIYTNLKNSRMNDYLKYLDLVFRTYGLSNEFKVEEN